jgi:hypothetical protein
MQGAPWTNVVAMRELKDLDVDCGRFCGLENEGCQSQQAKEELLTCVDHPRGIKTLKKRQKETRPL